MICEWVLSTHQFFPGQEAGAGTPQQPFLAVQRLQSRYLANWKKVSVSLEIHTKSSFFLLRVVNHRNASCYCRQTYGNKSVCVCVCVCVLITQSCLTLCDPRDCILPGSSVHGFLQARILEWVTIPFSRGTFWPRDRIWVSWITSGFFTIWAIREAQQKYTFIQTSNLWKDNTNNNQTEVNYILKINLWNRIS